MKWMFFGMKLKQMVCNLGALNRVTLFLLLFLQFDAGIITAQENDSIQLWKGYPKSFLRDTRDLILFPKSLKSNDWWLIGGAGVTTGLAFLVDEKL